MGHLDPEDAAASLAHRRSQPVDRGHDAARRRHRRKSDLVIHEGMLQIDDDECRVRRVEIREGMLGSAPFDYPPHDGFRDACAVQFHQNSLIDQLGVGASGRISLTLRKSTHSPGGIG
jgi:hypothetical protein